MLKHLYTIVHRSAIRSTQKVKTTQCPSKDEMRPFHTMKYCLDMNRNKVPVCAITRINLKNIMPRERSQTQKAIVLFDSIYIKYPELGKFVETEIQLMVARTGRGG